MPISIFIMIFYENYFHGCSTRIRTSSQKLMRNYEMAMLDDAQEEYENKLRLTSAASQTRPQQEELNPESLADEVLMLKKLQRKTWRSFQPLCIQVGHSYSIQPNTVITFGSLVLAHAINLLVA
jgi:hypothetical protein